MRKNIAYEKNYTQQDKTIHDNRNDEEKKKNTENRVIKS